MKSSLSIMKKTILLAFVLLLTGFVKGQHPWQEISYPGNRELSGEFKSPPAEYGMILWWGWDGPMTDTVIKRDLDRIKTMGFRGVMIEAGYGMTAKYLSPQWFEMVKVAVSEAKIRGMKVWIEDEGKYPSGFAGGKFSQERPDLKMQGLVVTEKINMQSGEIISKKLPSFTLSAIAFNVNDSSYFPIDISTGELTWEAPEGSWQVILAGHRFRSSVTRSVNNPTRGKDTTASLMDYLNPLATKQFIEWTHEQYKKYIGAEFGYTFMGFMGDEPDFGYTPWTPQMANEFIARKGYDIRSNLAEFFVPGPNDETKRMKADYWDVWSGLFSENFFKVQADWCRENKIEYIVHLNHEDQLPGLIRSSGDFFRNMRYVGVPGIDAIWSQIWMDHVADYPKLASSAAHLYGRPRAFTESFAAYTHKPSVAQAKWVIDYQLARGINSVQIMFMSASTGKQRPASEASQAVQRGNFFQNDSFPAVAQYINRATWLLSQGHPVADIGVYFPTLSLWYGNNESNTALLDLSKQLLENHYDFDFIDEQALSGILTIENKKLVNLSMQSYKVVIIPPVSAISESSLNNLKEFASAGGTVIFWGKLPSIIVGKTFINAAQPEDLSWAYHVESGKSFSYLSNYLPLPDFRIYGDLPKVKSLHRRFNDSDLFFIFNEGLEPVSFNFMVPWDGKVKIWNAFTGEITSLRGNQISLGPWETIFLVKNRTNYNLSPR